jgi:hypothetical protein
VARAELAQGDLAGAINAATAGLAQEDAGSPYPGRLLLACKGLAALRGGAWDQGKAHLLEASDLAFVDGSLLRFGVATVRGHLAIAILDHRPRVEPKEIEALVAPLVEAALEVPGLTAAPRLRDSIDALLRSRPFPRQELVDRLEELIGWFPYGIEPWIWRDRAEG